MLLLYLYESILWLWIIYQDSKSFQIPDKALLLLSIFKLGCLVVDNTSLLPALTSACLLCALFWAIKKSFDTRLKRIALGWGDVKLAWVCGLWIAPQDVSLFLIMTGMLGCLMGFVYRWVWQHTYLPLGPAMIGALSIIRFYKGVG